MFKTYSGNGFILLYTLPKIVGKSEGTVCLHMSETWNIKIGK